MLAPTALCASMLERFNAFRGGEGERGFYTFSVPHISCTCISNTLLVKSRWVNN